MSQSLDAIVTPHTRLAPNLIFDHNMPHSSDVYHDYLDTMGSQMEAETTFGSGFNFGVPEDDFDDYMNQLSEYMLH